MTLEDLAGEHQAFGRYDGREQRVPFGRPKGTAGRLQRRSVCTVGNRDRGVWKQRGSCSGDRLPLVAPPAGRPATEAATSQLGGEEEGERCGRLKAIWEEGAGKGDLRLCGNRN